MRAKDTKLVVYLEKRTSYSAGKEAEHEFTLQVQTDEGANLDMFGTAKEVADRLSELVEGANECLAVLDVHLLGSK